MAELDQIFVCNPTDKEFTTKKNGESYTLEAGESTIRPQYLARHMAKHLSDIECMTYFKSEEVKYKRRKEKMPDAKKTELLMFDNPIRRIALYKILQSTQEVETVILSYPQFKARLVPGRGLEFAFIGEMEVYTDFVAAFDSKEGSSTSAPQLSKSAQVAALKQQLETLEGKPEEKKEEVSDKKETEADGEKKDTPPTNV